MTTKLLRFIKHFVLAKVYTERPVKMNCKKKSSFTLSNICRISIVILLLIGVFTGCTPVVFLNTARMVVSNTASTAGSEAPEPDIGSESAKPGISTDSAEPDIYREEIGAGNIIYVYDSSYYDQVFGKSEITLDDLYATIDSNSNVPEDVADLIKEFCERYVTYAPDADRRVLNHNLQTLTVEAIDPTVLLVVTCSDTVLACYIHRDNLIYVLDDYDFRGDTWAYQILFHELCHAARICRADLDGHAYRVQSGGNSYDCTILDETLNTVFSVSLLGYEEKDIGYQLQSNMMTAIVRSMDNYEISDYMNHSQNYFLIKLDEFTGQSGLAAQMIDLMNEQYTRYSESNKSTSQQKMAPLYEYISNIYYKNRITENMSYDEAVSVKNELVDLLSFDVPDEYDINWKFFDRYFTQYCKKMGITVPR